MGGLAKLSQCNAAPHRWRGGGCVWASHGQLHLPQPSRNAAVGGARHSYHLSGSATDFRIHGNARAVHAYLSSNRSVGGLKHYGGGLFHIVSAPAGRGESQRR